MRYRYRLQRKETHVIYPDAGKPYPVQTYRWVDIALSNDIGALMESCGGNLPAGYRIIDTENCDRVVKTGRR